MIDLRKITNSIQQRLMKETVLKKLFGQLHWILALLTAALLANIGWIESKYYPLIELSKGSVAPYTIRATHDAVYDLHETYQAEAAEAKLNYLPIYNRDEDLPYDRLKKILKSAWAEPIKYWNFPLLPEHETSETDADIDSNVEGNDEAEESQTRQDDSGISDDGGIIGGGGTDEIVDERHRELEALIVGCFRLLETYYRDGVVGDNEFPKEKKTIRVFYRNEYNMKPVDELHRFSSLRPALQASVAQVFFKTDAQVREQVINYILQRLPPNLTYAKENEKFITDISQVTGVKVVLIRSGDILVNRGQVVDTRAYYAIRASIAASNGTSRFSNTISRMSLFLALMILFIIASREICPGHFRTARPYFLVYGGIISLAVLGEFMLLYFPLNAALIPQAALALTMAIVLGRAPGLLTSVTVPSCLILTQDFNLATLLVWVSGGITAALIVKHRRRGSALAAGVLIGIVQALVFEASRVLEGRPRTYAELWSASQAFLGGILSGVVALASLPFMEWLLGKSSRGTLRVLTDFDHPLLRELREKAPGTFAHTVTLLNLVEPAVEAVGGDRLLARAGTLYHDLGKIAQPFYFNENQGIGTSIHEHLSPEESAQAIIAHVENGLKIARKHHLRPDVIAFIAEHHGTTSVDAYFRRAREAGQEPDLSLFQYPGPKPQSIETAILMIADAVEVAAKKIEEPNEAAINQMVDKVIFLKLSEFQFDECGITQAQLKQVKIAISNYLKGTIYRRTIVSHPHSI